MQTFSGPMYNGLAMDPYQQSPFGINQNQYSNGMNTPSVVQQQPQRPTVDPRKFETPTITMGESHKPLFTVSNGEGAANPIRVDRAEISTDVKEKRKYTPKKKDPVVEDSTGIIKADAPLSGTVEPNSTIYTYAETNKLLHETLGQIDAINTELVQEFDSVRHNRTLKNKYMVINDLSENISSMLSNRLTAIKEINNCISKSNDMDYKKRKDIEQAQATMNDDKYISDLYQAFINNPQNIAPTYQMPQMDTSMSSAMGSGIIRANINSNDLGKSNAMMDAGYLNYVANLTPEQNLMRYEGNPDVKQVVVYDAQSGAKFFQVMNVRTGEVIPNVPVYDQMFMEDTTLDLKSGIAKNINLNESFPIITINDNIMKEY